MVAKVGKEEHRFLACNTRPRSAAADTDPFLFVPAAGQNNRKVISGSEALPAGRREATDAGGGGLIDGNLI